MNPLKATLPILAFFSAALTAYSEDPKQTKEIESSVNQFLEKENKALREIIANAVKRKSFLVYDNGKVAKFKIWIFPYFSKRQLKASTKTEIFNLLRKHGDKKGEELKTEGKWNTH